MRRPRQCGGIALGLVSALIFAGFIGWYGFTEYQRNYWDDRVRSICAEPGSEQVFSKVMLSDAEYEAIPRVGGHLAGFAPRELTRPSVPTYVRNT